MPGRRGSRGMGAGKGRGKCWNSAQDIEFGKFGKNVRRQRRATQESYSSEDKNYGENELESLKEKAKRLKTRLRLIDDQSKGLQSGSPSRRPVVNRDECAGCGVCVDVCPVGAITLDKVAKVGPECVGCGECADACPREAIVFK